MILADCLRYTLPNRVAPITTVTSLHSMCLLFSQNDCTFSDQVRTFKQKLGGKKYLGSNKIWGQQIFLKFIFRGRSQNRVLAQWGSKDPSLMYAIFYFFPILNIYIDLFSKSILVYFSKTKKKFTVHSKQGSMIKL